MATSKRIGKFTLVGELGKGGMGTVFEAIQDGLERHVAIKVLPKSIAKNGKFIERFRNEAKAIAKLNHPNVVTIFDIGEDRGFHFFSMELVDGESLDDYLKRKGPLQPQETVDFLDQATQGLDHAWQNGIVHRDLKPANMLLSKNGVLKIADFGIAKLAGDVSSFTVTGTSMGTLFYMSPEQGNNAKHVDHRADIYSLGASFFHLVTGRVPFEAETPFEAAVKISTEALAPVRTVNSDVPESIASLIERMLEKDPDDRLQDAEELMHAIETCRQQIGTETASGNNDTLTGPPQGKTTHPNTLPSETTDQPAKEKPAPVDRLDGDSKSKRRWAALAVLLVTAAVASIYMFYAQRSIMVVSPEEIGEADVALSVLHDGKTIAEVNAATDWRIRLKHGKYTLRASGEDAKRFVVIPDTIDLTQNEGKSAPVVLRAYRAPNGLKLAPSLIQEGSSHGSVVGKLTVADPDLPYDAHTLRVVPNADTNSPPRFSITDNHELAVTPYWNGDHEGGGEEDRSVMIEVTDRSGLSYREQVEVEITDVAEAPTDVTLLGMRTNTGWLIPPGVETDVSIGQLIGEDQDSGDAVSIYLDANEDRFAIDGSGNLLLERALRPGIHTLQLRAVDTTQREWNSQVQVHLMGLTSLLTQIADLNVVDRTTNDENEVPKRTLDVAISPDGSQVLVGTSTGNIEIWDVNSKRRVRVFRESDAQEDAYVSLVRWSADGNQFISAGSSQRVLVWEPNQDRPVKQFDFSCGETEALALSPDGSWIAAGFENGHVAAWKLAAPSTRPETFAWHHVPINSVAFGSSEEILICNTDGVFRRLNVNQIQQSLDSIAPFSTQARFVASNGNGIVAFVPTENHHTIMICNLNATNESIDNALANAIQASSPTVNHEVTDLIISSDGSTVVTRHDKGTTCFWDTAKHRVSYQHPFSSLGKTTPLSMSLNGQYFAQLGIDESVEVYSISRQHDAAANWQLLVPPSASWRYTPQTAAAPADWMRADFDDSGWDAAAAPLGYGEPGRQAAEWQEKTLSGYFRHEFEITDVGRIRSAAVGFVRDDGIAVYLNGKEIARDNLPQVVTEAGAAIHTIGDASEYFWRYVEVKPADLVTGRNVIAAEAHQTGAGSSDLYFQLMLSVELKD